MTPEEARVVRPIQDFATELTRAPLYDCGHADAWEHVRRALTVDGLLFALGLLRGIRRLRPPGLPMGLDGVAHRGHPGDRGPYACRCRARPRFSDPRAPTAIYRAELAELLNRERTRQHATS